MDSYSLLLSFLIQLAKDFTDDAARISEEDREVDDWFTEEEQWELMTNDGLGGARDALTH